MSVSVTMPRLGESVSEGTVTRWLKNEGDRVEADEPLLEVSTDKVDTEIPAPASGVLTSIKVGEDETVDVGAELGTIDDGSGGGGGSGDGAQAQAEAPAEAEAEAPAEAEAEAPAEAEAEAPAEAEAEAPAEAEAEAPAEAEAEAPAEAEAEAPAEAEAEAPAEAEAEAPAEAEAEAPAEAEAEAPAEAEAEAPAEAEAEAPAEAEAEAPAQQAPPQEQSAQPASDQQEPADQEPAQQAPEQQEPADQEPAQQAPRQQEQQPQQEQPPGEHESEARESQQPQPPGEHESEARESQQPQPQDSRPQPGAAADDGQGAYVTPLVRKLAAEHSVDLSAITGTGVGGRIRKQDVLDAAQSAPDDEPVDAPAPAAAAPATALTAAVPAESSLRGRTEKVSRLRAVIASRMVESLQVSAQLTTVVEVDVTRIARLRQQAKAAFEAQEGVKLSFLPFFGLATVEALKVHPKVNASIDMENGTVTYHDAEHLGIAVDTERGLLVPVIHDAGDLNLAGMARKIADLAERTRAGKVTPDELGGGTFTLTNTGSRGALFDTPIINQPQVGVLGTGSVVKRPVVVDDPNLGESITVRSMVYLALTYDHRLVDGADAARFLGTVKERLETGTFELALSR